MDPASLAAALVGAQSGQIQLAFADKMMKMNADHNTAFAQMIAAAAQGTRQAAIPAAGTGQSLDISA
jgi:hypothetical protein